MSRTRHGDRHWRNIKNGAFIKKRLHWWSDDFIHKKKDRVWSRQLRTKLKKEDRKEIGRYV